jgi:hypothetical protein
MIGSWTWHRSVPASFIPTAQCISGSGVRQKYVKDIERSSSMPEKVESKVSFWKNRFIGDGIEKSLLPPCRCAG